ncbi:MAG: methyl-accepting chemotaxis protein [Treponema sp.]|nr:methyl-accepting chemotaxis protein [Treponema sp.]
MKNKKVSFAVIITIYSMVIILCITIAISAVFFYNLRNLSHRQVISNTRLTMSHLKSEVIGMLQGYNDLLTHTAVGVVSLLEQNRDLPRESMRRFFSEIKETAPEVEWLYYSSNSKWDEPGGYFELNVEWIPDADYDQRERPWFIEAKKAGGQIAFLEPYIDIAKGNLSIAISLQIFDSEGRDIGVVCAEIVVAFLNTLLHGDRNEAIWLIDKNGHFVTHPDLEVVLNKKNFFAETGLTEFQNEVLSSADNFFAENKDTFIDSAPIPQAGWYLVSTISRSEAYAETNRVLLLVVFMLAGLIVGSAVILTLIVRRMVKPLKNVAGTLQEISQDWNLSKRVEIKKTGGIAEIYEISSVFNMTFDKIKSLVAVIKKQATNLHNIGSDLASDMTETAATVNEITSTIQSIKNRVLNQSASVTETHATMEQVVVNIDKLDGLVDKQSSSTSRASSAVEEMAANIDSVSATLANNAANVQTLSEASEVGKTGLQEVAEDIQEISRESEGLMEINSVMENIASQTNLLSMNAAIEAAHAGEAGKGFAVVADEIRKLAESSGEQSKTIATVLKKIKGSIDNIMKSTENVLTRFEAIDLSIKVVSDQEEQIRNAMEEQGVGSREIVKGVMEVNDITQKVKVSSHEMLEGSTEVIRESTDLEKVTQEIAFGMNEMASGAEQMNVAVHHVSELSSKTREGIEVLIKEIAQFKAE